MTWLKFGTVKGGKTHCHVGGGTALCDPTIQFETTGNLGEVSCKHCLRKMGDDPHMLRDSSKRDKSRPHPMAMAIIDYIESGGPARDRQ